MAKTVIVRPIAPTFTPIMKTSSFSNPYQIHRNAPIATNITKYFETSSSFFVLYPLTIWGIHPERIKTPAAIANIEIEISSKAKIFT